MKGKKNLASWLFLLVVGGVYLLVGITMPLVFFQGLTVFVQVFSRIVPVLVFVFVLMILTDYFIKPKALAKKMQKSESKKWLFAVAGGILSTGAAYLWYPLLSELKEKGLSYGHIACFLYNRAVKIPLIPMAVFYFGWKYMLILTVVMVFVSFIQGVIIEKVMGE